MERVSHLFELVSEEQAGPTPGGVKVDDQGLGALLDHHFKLLSIQLVHRLPSKKLKSF
jgi:hypothetical protein